MLNPFVCGTFHHEKDDDEPCFASPGSSPRKYKRKDSRNNNPYSARGLDKFSALLADLDEKRQKIYSQMRPQDISFVRFVYSNTDDVIPIVVKVKNKDQKQRNQELKAQDLTPTSEPVNNSASVTESNDIVEERKQPKIESDEKVAKKRFFWNMKWDMLARPSFYVPVVVILILVFLTVFGRSVATLCTCIVWYIVPTLRDRSLKSGKSMKKKDYARRLSEKKIATEEMKKKDYVRWWSEKKMVTDQGVKKKEYDRRWSEKKMATEGLVSSPRSNSEASKDKSAAKHGHMKSW